MKTQVEIFEVEEVRTETVEQSAEALQLIESLGLDGQRPQVVENQTAIAVRFPYRLMTDEELFVYSHLCPQRTPAKNYSDEPIPLEVLKTMSYAKSLNDKRITHFEIWSAETVKVKDPILVARDGPYGSKNYLLARWGTELLPLEVLMPDAIKKWYDNRVDKINEHIATLQRELLIPIPKSYPRGRSELYLSL